MSLTAFRDGWITIALNGEVKNENTTEPRKGIRNFVFHSHLVLICAPVYGQWVKVPTGRIPRGPDGKPNLSAPAPRSPDGHPDLSGVWESGGARYILDIAADLNPATVPFMPWAKALVDERADGSHSERIPLQTACPEASRGSMPRPHLGR